MARIFGSRPVSLTEGVAIVGVGVALLVLLELEKLIRRSLGLDRRAEQRSTPDRR